MAYCQNAGMDSVMKKFFLLILLSLVLLPAAAFSKDLPHLDMPGLARLLQENKGKVVLLNFFATWCPPCRTEIPYLIKAHERFAGKDVLIVSLSVDDSAAAVPPFIRQMGMDYPVYTVDRNVARAYRVSSIPHNVLYGRDGKLAASHSGVLDEASLISVIDQLSRQ